MGCTRSSQVLSMDQIQAKNHDKKIAKDLDIDARNNKKVHKLLLLGAGESGKSTLFKQMNHIYGKKFPPEDRAKYVQTIHNNVIDSCRVLALHVDKFGQGCDSQEGQESKARFENITESVLTQELATSAKQLWFDPGIQRTYRARNKFQLHDSTQYFLEKVDQMWMLDWMPSVQDVLRSRVRTTGIVENEFIIPTDDNKPNIFRMYDVGGQRGERKKWISLFDGVSAVLFVAAISEYDQVIAEDGKTNRIIEAINLFEEMVNNPVFTKVSFMLFLNKSDLFKEKLKVVSIKSAFPAYDGPEQVTGDCNLERLYEICYEYIKEEFLAGVHTDKEVTCHLTCATDTSHVAKIFQTVRDAVFMRNLEAAGLLH